MQATYQMPSSMKPERSKNNFELARLQMVRNLVQQATGHELGNTGGQAAKELLKTFSINEVVLLMSNTIKGEL